MIRGAAGTNIPAAPTAHLARIVYKPGWTFKVGGPDRRYLCVFATNTDTLVPSRERCTQHMFELPPEDLTLREFSRWLLEQLHTAERHETCEWLQVGGQRPFFPEHGDGDPYKPVERWDD